MNGAQCTAASDHKLMHTPPHYDANTSVRVGIFPVMFTDLCL